MPDDNAEGDSLTMPIRPQHRWLYPLDWPSCQP